MGKYLNLENRIFTGVGPFDIPEIKPVTKIDATLWLGFNYVKTNLKASPNTGVHFFLDDYQFERVWNFPEKYTEYLRNFSCVLSPDFSLYTDFPKAVQIYNHYRKHWLAAYWQELGLTVIPTIAWSDEASFEWCFDGEPKHSIVAVSNVGCMNNDDTKQMFERGYYEMLDRLQPTEVLFYTRRFDTGYKGPIRYIRHMTGFAEEA